MRVDTRSYEVDTYGNTVGQFIFEGYKFHEQTSLWIYIPQNNHQIHAIPNHFIDESQNKLNFQWNKLSSFLKIYRIHETYNYQKTVPYSKMF